MNDCTIHPSFNEENAYGRNNKLKSLFFVRLKGNRRCDFALKIVEDALFKPFVPVTLMGFILSLFQCSLQSSFLDIQPMQLIRTQCQEECCMFTSFFIFILCLM